MKDKDLIEYTYNFFDQKSTLEIIIEQIYAN